MSLVKGLVLGGMVKIHINGLFLEEIKLDWGVHQGCPLVPLLFALTIELILAFLQEDHLQGQMMKIHISKSLSICEWLFANGMGITIPAQSKCFKQVEDCISLYELAWGAKLNIRKSTIIPLGLHVIPQGLIDKGYVSLPEGNLRRYLGAQLGYNVYGRNIQDYCLDCVCKRISSWKGWHTSFGGKVILLKQVLMAILVYYMMSSHF